MKNNIYKINFNWSIKLKQKTIGGPKINNDNCCHFIKKIRRRGTGMKLCIYDQF